MSLQVRRIVITGALLLVFVVTLSFRLDIENLNRHVQQEMEGFTDVALRAKESEFSFMHGIGIRLNQVSLKQQHYQIEAGHMNVTIRLLPLLLGKIEIDSLDIHDAIIKVRPEALQPTSTAISTLPVERIELVRSHIKTFDGKDILNNLYLELRDIGSNRETLWELKAQQQNHSLSGHGRLNFYHGELTAGFGKLKLDRIPLSRLRAVTPESIFDWFESSDGNISGSLALDITRNQSWAVFGELSLLGNDQTPSLRMRGKLEHPEANHLVWHDSFIHFNEEAVIAIDGECIDNVCETGLDAMNIDLKTWFPLLPESITFHQRISGSTDLNAHVQWSNKGWDSSAAFKLKDASYLYNHERYPLPELDIQTEELRGDSLSWHAKAIVASPNEKGELTIISSQNRAGLKDMQMIASKVNASLVQPLANLLLSSLDINPQLRADGSISGRVQLQQKRDKKSLLLEFSGTDAELSYPELFKKPANIETACKASINWNSDNNHPDKIALDSCGLNRSLVKRASWQQDGGKHQLQIEKLHLNFDQLKQNAVLLPEQFHAFQGVFEGSGSMYWNAQRPTAIPGWLKSINGQWRLQNFGKKRWRVNGNIEAGKGQIAFSRLLLEGTNGQAELKGFVDLSKANGDVDILGGTADVSDYPSLPSGLDSLNIRGRIHHASLKGLGNQLQAIHGYYRMHRGKLRLENIQGVIAGGQLNSKKMTLSAADEGYMLAGKLRLKGVSLEQLNGLNQLFQAELKGDLHANLELHGQLPLQTAQAWQQSNGDILVYSGEWSRQGKADTLTERLGIKKPEFISHPFRELNLRFRVHEGGADIRKITLHHNGERYRGRVLIHADQAIQGEMQSSDRKKRYSLAGSWLLPTWQLLP